MTTLVYQHSKKLIAMDGRLTGDNAIMSETFDKSYQHSDGSMWFLCGAVCDQPKLIEAYEGKEFPADRNINVNAFFVKDGKVYRCGIEEGLFWCDEVNDNRTMGTGWEWALAALDFGKDVIEAVQYAASRDYCTNANVSVFDIAENKFITKVAKS